MSDKDRAVAMIQELEKQVSSLIGQFSSREWSIAVTKMEECAMWMRKAIERA